jgi:hypothetical protein
MPRGQNSKYLWIPILEKINFGSNSDIEIYACKTNLLSPEALFRDEYFQTSRFHSQRASIGQLVDHGLD